MSRIFQNIDPPPFVAGGGHTRRAEGGGDGGSIFWKTQDIKLASYSNNLSTVLLQPVLPLPLAICVLQAKCVTLDVSVLQRCPVSSTAVGAALDVLQESALPLNMSIIFYSS
jgi:hypothetical protein